MKIKNIGRTVLLLTMLGAFFSCQEKPVFTLSDDDLKMVSVLVDVYTVEASLREITDLQQKDSLKAAYFKQIYQIHHIDADWLNTQRQRLETDPVRMDSIYSRSLIFIETVKSDGNRPL